MSGVPLILVVSAHRPELTGLRAILGDDLRGTSGGRSVVARAVGIGLSAAAVGTVSALAEFEPRAVVFVGTCGAYAGRGPSIGEAVVGRKVHLVSVAEVEGRADFPEPMRTELDLDGMLADALASAGARQVTVATTVAITTDDLLAEQIAARRGSPIIAPRVTPPVRSSPAGSSTEHAGSKSLMEVPLKRENERRSR